MSFRQGLLTLLCLLLTAPSAFSTATVRRFALAAGANYGGGQRPTLRYAVSDAENFAQVLSALGGVESSDLVVLRQPGLIELEDALEGFRDLVTSSTTAMARDEPVRTEVILYFSGHANETGLLLGDETFSYRSLRNWMDLVDADVRIAVLDACASGAITRLKGGRHRKPFLVDASTDMRGHAFLTSSSEDEAAQESDRVGGSFFTHYLVSGLRGAADVSGEGTVTLNEAYQFAFHETLGRTTETQAGAQHPSYDINLSGTGDVVMTDLRQTTAGLVLDEDLSGRFFVRDDKDQLVVELYKNQGRSVELGLEPGPYEVRCELPSNILVSSATLKDGESVTLGLGDFTPTDPEQVTVRGGGTSSHLPFGGMTGRHRIGLSFGFWGHGGSGYDPTPGVIARVDGLGGGLGYSYWFREDLALTLNLAGYAVDVESGVGARSTSIASFLVGARWYPLPPTQFKPYITGGIGPFIGSRNEAGVGFARSVTTAAAGGQLGGGFDAQITRSFMIGVMAGYNFMSDFSTPLADKTNFSGPGISVEFSFLWGKGRVPGVSAPTQ